MSNVKELNINSTTYDIIGKGVVDQNNPSTPLKQWSGTKAQYDALVSGGTVDANTLYNITDDAVASDFANTDLSNLTTTGKSYAAGIGMPSDTYEDIGTSPYVAPANGWVSTAGTCAGNVWAFICTVVCESTSTSDNDKVKYRDICWCGIANNVMFTMTPVKKGDKVWFGSSNFSTNSLRFIYSEGEV